MPTIYLFPDERLDEASEVAVRQAMRDHAGPHVWVGASEHEVTPWHALVASMRAEMASDPAVTFEFLPSDADEADVLRRLAHGLWSALASPDATVAPLVAKASTLAIQQAVESAQALASRASAVSLSTRCRHVAKQIATHLLKLGLPRTSPPYDLVAAIALDLFLRGEQARSLEQLQEAIRTSAVPTGSTATPLRHRSFKRMIVHTDLSFHPRATEADIDDLHAVVYVLSKSLGDDAEPYPHEALDLVLSARHKDADLCVSDGVAVPLTTPTSVLELVEEQTRRFHWQVVARTDDTIVARSDARQRTLTVRVHTESLDDNRALEETLARAYERDDHARFVTLLIGPVTPEMARLYASCSLVISGTSVDEGVNAGMTTHDPRLRGGRLLPELCDPHPMYDLGPVEVEVARAPADEGLRRPVLLNLKPSLSRFLFTPGEIVQHPAVAMAQYEYALKTVARPFWKCRSSGMEVRLAYSNGLTTPREGPGAVVERLRRHIDARSDTSLVLDEYRALHPLAADERLVDCAMQHAAAVVLNVLIEYRTGSPAHEALREQYVAFVHDGAGAVDMQRLYDASTRDGWSHAEAPSADPIAAMLRVQMPDATPTSVACLLRCMLALFLHRFVQVEYARRASGLPRGDLVRFHRALPHLILDEPSSALYYRLEPPCRIGECAVLTRS